MSGFYNGFSSGLGLGFGYLSLYGRGYGLAACNQLATSSPYIFSAYADLDRPSGLSSVIPAVDYGLNGGYYGGYYGGYSGFTYPSVGALGLPCSLGFGIYGGFGYYC